MASITPYFESRGTPLPLYVNPAEFLLTLTSSDFAVEQDDAEARIAKLHSDWQSSPEAERLKDAIETIVAEKADLNTADESQSRGTFSTVVIALLHRSFIKSYRDVVAYGIRVVMYIGTSRYSQTLALNLI